MGGALAQAVIRSVGAENVAVSDKNEGILAAFQAKYGATALTNEELIRCCDFVFLGVKPQFLAGFAEEMKKVIAERANQITLVSMIAGTPIAKLETLFGCALSVIRIMPNTPAAVGEGMILCHPNAAVAPEKTERFQQLFRLAGMLDFIPESLIAAGCAISGCGPAFAYLFIDAMADAGVALGLTKKQATLYAAQTLLGAAKMTMETEQSPANLKDAVCSPGGSTIAGVKAVEKNAFRYAVIDAVTEAYQKTTQL